MGALAPSLPSWIPEDDLLLKNAVEAGASLESLAKGAVHFSRRYTIRELQERWQSLLYDLDTAAEASAHMLEIELSVSNLLKSNKPCNSKGEDMISGKRKIDRVRSYYYSMRKRICNEPCNSIDLSFLMAPSVHICTGSKGVCEEPLKLHTGHVIENCMLGGSMSNHIELPETGFDIGHHDFPLMVNVDAATADTHICDHYPLFDPVGHEVDHECGHMYKNVSTVSGDKTLGNGGGAFEHNDMHKDMPQILENGMAGFQNFPGVQELRPPETSSVSNLFGSNELETKPSSTFNSLNSNCGNACSDFGGSQNFNSPVSDCSASFHQLEYSSAMPDMSIWGTTEHISTPDMPIERHLEVKDQIVRANLHVDDVAHTETSLTNRMPSDGLTNSTTIVEGDFMDLSNSLLNLENEEALLYMDVDEKDIGEGSCLNGLDSILSSSPNDVVHGDEVPDLGEPKASIALEACLMIPDRAYHGGLEGIGNSLGSTLRDGNNNICDSEVNVATASAQNPSPEFLKGFICCTLNTEDTEIPCNDDVFSSTAVSTPVSSSVMQLKSKETTRPVSSIKGVVDIHRGSVPGLGPIMGGEETRAQSFLASQMRGSPSVSEMGHDHGVKTELHESDSIAMASRNVVNTDEDPNLCTPLPVTLHSVSTIAMKEEIAGPEVEKHENFDRSAISFLENPVQASDHTTDYNLNMIGGCKRDEDLSVAVQKNTIISHAEPGSGEIGVLEPVVNFLTSDQEEQFFESDDDVPYFSDIEAMILDMDLIPNDQESYFAKEVSRYQYEDTKKSIIRLEQGAYSYMQRAISSHGAFAIFYGRHLKHYIKKPEISLGRATEDVNVDIDLQREGRANKISRRQAIIKMEEDGSFYLKNLGKCSILVNNKEVATGLRSNLPSNCLIEIRGMRFMFEINLNAVKQYITNSLRSEERSARFEWVPDEIS